MTRRLTRDSKPTLQPRLAIFVPEVDCAIRSGGRERAMLHMEADVVHSKELGIATRLAGTWIFAVAFEREVVSGREGARRVRQKGQMGEWHNSAGRSRYSRCVFFFHVSVNQGPAFVSAASPSPQRHVR